MKIVRKVLRVGVDSNMIIIPKEDSEKLNIKPGDFVVGHIKKVDV